MRLHKEESYLLLPAAAKSCEDVLSKGVLLDRLCVPLLGGSEAAIAPA